MSEVVVQQLYAPDKKRRVLIIQHANGFFGYEEEYFSEDPMELTWCRLSQVPFAICESAEAALQEAQGRVSWLAAGTR